MDEILYVDWEEGATAQWRIRKSSEMDADIEEKEEIKKPSDRQQQQEKRNTSITQSIDGNPSQYNWMSLNRVHTTTWSSSGFQPRAKRTTANIDNAGDYHKQVDTYVSVRGLLVIYDWWDRERDATQPTNVDRRQRRVTSAAERVFNSSSRGRSANECVYVQLIHMKSQTGWGNQVPFIGRKNLGRYGM